jgi:hypothetical protein
MLAMVLVLVFVDFLGLQDFSRSLPESEEEISALPINSETKAIVFNA